MSVFRLKNTILNTDNHLNIPNDYNITEWLSHIYYMSNGYSSVIKSRKAPDQFLKKFISKIENDNTFKQHKKINQDLYNIISEDSIKYNDCKYPLI